RDHGLDDREAELGKAAGRLEQTAAELQAARERTEQDREEVDRALQRVAGMSAAEAKASLMRRLEEDAKRDAMALVRDLETKAREEAEQRARRIVTLAKLVSDGRIHPARIEEMAERARSEVEEEVRRAGEEAILDVGITDIHPELLRVLGRLKYRTSYGQNVLKHLVETSHIAGMLGAELGMNRDEVRLLKRCGLLHDIGKAVTHEVEGSHALIGAELARRLKEPVEVVHA